MIYQEVSDDRFEEELAIKLLAVACEVGDIFGISAIEVMSRFRGREPKLFAIIAHISCRQDQKST